MPAYCYRKVCNGALGVWSQRPWKNAWSAKCHVWGCVGLNFRLFENLSKTGTEPRGGATSEDYLSFLKTVLYPKSAS